jgi:hypothetical protein
MEKAVTTNIEVDFNINVSGNAPKNKTDEHTEANSIN